MDPTFNDISELIFAMTWLQVGDRHAMNHWLPNTKRSTESIEQSLQEGSILGLNITILMQKPLHSVQHMVKIKIKQTKQQDTMPRIIDTVNIWQRTRKHTAGQYHTTIGDALGPF